MEEVITALLLGDARLRSRVGDRVHWGVAPQGIGRPYVILQVISGQPDTVNSGRTGMESARLQIDGYAETVLEARDISNFAIAALERAPGLRGGITLQGAFIDNRRDFQPDSTAGKARLFRRSTDIIIWFSQET